MRAQSSWPRDANATWGDKGDAALGQLRCFGRMQLRLTHNVKVTGTLRQGAARCMISNGAVRPLAATCPSRPFC